MRKRAPIVHLVPSLRDSTRTQCCNKPISKIMYASTHYARVTCKKRRP